MNAPKEIYVHEVSAQELSEPKLNEYHVKYVRADLAKLDWVDVSIMDEILHEVLEQEKIHIEQGPASYYEEVLRRFNEYKEERNSK